MHTTDTVSWASLQPLFWPAALLRSELSQKQDSCNLQGPMALAAFHAAVPERLPADTIAINTAIAAHQTAKGVRLVQGRAVGP